jgi:hypothetical protein
MLQQEVNDGAAAPAMDDTRVQDAAPAPQPEQDIDAADLAAALAAAEAEERAAQEQHEAPIGNAAEPQGDAAASETPADDEGLPDSTPGAVPYARFSQVNQKLNQTAAELEFMRGKVEAMEALAKGGSAPANQPAPTGQQQTAPAAPSPDPIKAHRDAIKAEAQRYDAGEITLAEYEAFRMEREDQIQAIHLQRVTEQAARQVAQPSMADEAMLAAHAKALDSQYPYLQVMSQDQLLRLRDMAIMEANQNGRPFGNSANDTRLLRERVALLSAGFGPAWGLQIPQQTSANTQPGNRGATGQPTMSPAAQARMMKHGLAADMPPDTHNMGTAGNGETFSEQRIAAMTDEEILALPATVRQRFLTG